MMDLISNDAASAMASGTHAVHFVPLAITQSDSTHGCVAGLSVTGEWLRPEPIMAAELGKGSVYQYRRFCRAYLGPSEAEDCRPEDRHVLAPTTVATDMKTVTTDAAWLNWYRAHCDKHVESCFVGERSVGLIEVTPERVYAKRATGQRVFARMAFRDATGEAFDWIVPEIAFSSYVLERLSPNARAAEEAAILKPLQQRKVFLCLGLTKPNNRFPGKFRGCHPLVVGVHSFLEYGG